MISSQAEYFKMSIVTPEDKNFRIFTKEKGKHYICVEEDQPFKVSIQLQRPRFDMYYSSKLFIDGAEIKGFKSFWKSNLYHGFKNGFGNYNEFLFSEPPAFEEEIKERMQQPMMDIPDSINLEDTSTRSSDFGIIELRLYKTFPSSKKKRHTNPVQTQKYAQLPRLDDKKYFERALSVRKGKNFQLNFPNGKNEFYFYGEEYSSRVNSSGKRPRIRFENHDDRPDVWADFDTTIDSCKIRYRSFFSMVILGLIHLQNVSHLSFIPDSLLQQSEYMKIVFTTIIKNEKKNKKKAGLEVCFMDDRFEKFTNRKMGDYEFFTDDNLTFFEEFPDFLIDYEKMLIKVRPEPKEDKSVSKVSEKEEKTKRIAYPHEIPNHYYMTNNDKRLKKTEDQKNSSRMTNMTTIFTIDESCDLDIIDLTLLPD